MAISVDWGNSVIQVPKADTTLVNAGPPEIRSYDVDAFRLELKAAEAAIAGAPFPKTHIHNTKVTLSGFVYARTVEIIAPYTVEFEDGQYSVQLSGANHNIVDVSVENQVRLVAQNSAGLIEKGTGLTAEQQAFLREVWTILGLDSDNPLVVTPTTQAASSITLTRTEDSPTPGDLTVQRS